MRRRPIFAPSRLSGGRLACLLLLAGGPVLAGCDRSPDEQELQALFDEGEYLCREEHWQEARAVLKKYLLYDPDHAGAHYYLGRAYLLSRPVIAEGELQTALELFIEGGRISTIERFGHDYFELICNIDSAKTCLLQIDLMRAWGAPPAAVQSLLERAEGYVREADTIMPGTKEVGALERMIALYRTLRSRAFRENRNSKDTPTRA